MANGFDAEILHGFNFAAEFKTLPDGRVKATTTVGGKAFEVFDTDIKWANTKLTEKVSEAVMNGDVTLNEL